MYPSVTLLLTQFRKLDQDIFEAHGIACVRVAFTRIGTGWPRIDTVSRFDHSTASPEADVH